MDTLSYKTVSANKESANKKWFIGSYTDNPDLTCIQVDDYVYSTTNWTTIDNQHYFSLDW